eukprot:3304180-Rhodomonas_salina.3
MRFAGGKFAAMPVAVSGDYRFGAVVSHADNKTSILVKMLTGGAILCDFKVETGEEVTMLDFSSTGDILIAVLRKDNTSYIKVWSVITSDLLKLLNQPGIFPSGISPCLARSASSSSSSCAVDKHAA